MSADRRRQHKPIFDVMDATIEIFFADRTLETFGRRGAAPVGPAVGPFHTSYSAYRAFRHRSPKAAKIVGLSVGLFQSRATIVAQLQLLASIVWVLSWHHSPVQAVEIPVLQAISAAGRFDREQ